VTLASAQYWSRKAIPTERFEQVSMDFITTLPVTKENHDAVMVIVDKLNKLVMFIPTRTDMDAVETAKKFFKHWCFKLNFIWYILVSNA
jgi:hypothetical protein